MTPQEISNLTDQKQLASLAFDKDPFVRFFVAQNPRTSQETLALLASDISEDVMIAVARNASTGPSTLSVLSSSKSDPVRRGITWNPSTPPDVLTKLAADPDVDVRWGVASNWSTPPETLVNMGAGEGPAVLRAIALNPSMPRDVVEARRRQEGAQRAVAADPVTSADTLEKLDAAPEKPWTSWVKDFYEKVEFAVKGNPGEAVKIVAESKDAFTTCAALADERIALLKSVEQAQALPKSKPAL